MIERDGSNEWIWYRVNWNGQFNTRYKNKKEYKIPLPSADIYKGFGTAVRSNVFE